jgi:carbamoyl-phosphate synthase small subunit
LNVTHSALLALEDGTVFRGQSIGVTGMTTGEVVFNTAMTGYQEILTDPSYARQLVTLTYPHIGNTGSNPEDVESSGVFASGLVVRNVPRLASSWRSTSDLSGYLQQEGVVAIAEIDTRRLTRILREKGAQNGCIVAGDDPNGAGAVAAAKEFPGLKGMDLAREVTTSASFPWDEGEWDLESGYKEAADKRFRVVAYDFGIKRNILRMLTSRGCDLTVVPATTPAEEVLDYSPDGIFLSNGPGDPEPCEYAILAIRVLLTSGVPIFGICLGHQLLALAAGARTEKMKFGHHGANHPVQDVESGEIYITSQNHGFAVSEDSIPGDLKVTHRSLFDGTVQGVEHAERNAFSFQGHPEASPGPHDIAPLFDKFITMMVAPE